MWDNAETNANITEANTTDVKTTSADRIRETARVRSSSPTPHLWLDCSSDEAANLRRVHESWRLVPPWMRHDKTFVSVETFVCLCQENHETKAHPPSL